MAQQFIGTGVALVTPFKADKQVDFEALKKITRHVVGGGVDYLVVHGTTSEAPTLTKEEKHKTFSTIKENANGLPIVLGIGNNNTQQTVEIIQHHDFSDIDGILSIVPYYNKPTQSGLYEHFKAVAKVAPIPIILYNVPSRTGSNLEASTIVQLAKEFKNIVALKAASGDLSKISQVIEHAPKDFSVISGDDALTLPIMSIGGKGCISVLANALPKETSAVIDFALKNDYEKAQKAYLKIANMNRLIFKEGNPTGVKSLMHQLGLLENNLRLPLVASSQELDNLISY